MTDRDGDVVQQYGYTPFGKENYKNNTLAFSVSSRYTGQTLDEDTGLYYYGARYYDPELARFIQADSTIPDPEFSQAYNRYAYVYNNPLKFTDPTGQEPFTIAAAIIAIAQATAQALPAIMISTMISATIGCVMGAGPKDAFLGALASNLGTFFFGAIAGGALAAAATGGDPVQGAVSGGVSAGVQLCLGFSPAPSSVEFLSGEYLKSLALSTASGAVSGGVTAEILGGDFVEGAISGGSNAGSNFVVWSALQGMPTEGDPQADNPLPASESPGIPGPLGVVAQAVNIAALGATGTDPLNAEDSMLRVGLEFKDEAMSQPVKNPLKQRIASLFGGASTRISMAAVSAAGAAGEAAVRATYYIGDKARIVIGAGRVRFPDGLTTNVISEVKNVAYQAWTRQLADYASYASQHGLRFDLYVRSSTTLSPSVRAAEAAGRVNIKYIPGM